MKPLPTELRNKLERTIIEARDVAEAGAKAALEAIAVHHHEPYGHMSPAERKLRNHLRARARQLGDKQNQKGELELTHLVGECAYEHWHRMLFARFLAENDLLIEPEMGVAISLEECEELAKEDGKDLWTLASEFAQRMLPQIFRPNDPVLKVFLAREHRIKLENLLNDLELAIFSASDSLGWVYQFWQSKRKKEVNQSGNKIGADELPAVTQLFTEPYMVSFLLDNSLGAWWAARCDAGLGRVGETENGRIGEGVKGIFERAESEEEIRKACAIPGVPLEYLRFVPLPASTMTAAGDATLPSPSGRGAGGEGKKQVVPPDILENARELRKNQTDAEQLLWGLLRDRRFLGKKFRRQHPVGRYILDFYCHEEKLALEIDGGQHNPEDQREYDDKRTALLNEQGIRVIRFWNNEVLQQTESVLEALYLELSNKSSTPSPLTPLPKGEGKRGENSRQGREGQGMGTPTLTEEEELIWTPAAGTFDGWPEKLSELKVLDPCCGSGHFLVAAFLMLVPMRMELEGISAREACDAVLRENLHGLEIDKRCVELAAFALALAAWRYPDLPSPDGRLETSLLPLPLGEGWGEGVKPIGYRPLPELNVACSGHSISAGKEEWLALAGENTNLRISLEELYKQFKDAPVLGSLINPNIGLAKDSLFELKWEDIGPLLTKALSGEKDDEKNEIGVVARGIVKAAKLLSGKYHWIITNVPYLARGKQDERLKVFCEKYYPSAKNDLATVFLDRCIELCIEGGTASVVLPQNWLFLTSYKKFREKLLKNDSWHLIARLGEGGFDSSAAAGAFVVLLTMSRDNIASIQGGLFSKATSIGILRGLDVFEPRTAIEKAAGLLTAKIESLDQEKQLKNPDARVVLEETHSKNLLEFYSNSYWGLGSGDYPRFGKCFWEILMPQRDWIYQLSTVLKSKLYGAREHILYWQNGKGDLASNPGAFVRGTQIWGKRGIHVSQMRNLPVTLYTGECWDTNSSPIIPKKHDYLTAIWCFCSSSEYNDAVRKIDQKVNVTNATLIKVPFDLAYWRKVAVEKYPNGLPKPHSDDPTQWLFHGYPAKSENPLQISVARLLGYCWPAELDNNMELSDESLGLVYKSKTLLPLADEDGIVCIPSVRGEDAADSRLRALLSVAIGPDWSPSMEQELIKGTGSNTSKLDEWLRDHFFEQHCKLFHHRPFIWHIWVGSF